VEQERVGRTDASDLDGPDGRRTVPTSPPPYVPTSPRPHLPTEPVHGS
jgi:hypothetical protein